MGYRKRAGGGKRDAIEQAIVEALTGRMVSVWRLGGTGNPDLLVLIPGGRWMPIEVKSGNAPMTRNQQRIPWPIVRSVDDALNLVFGR